ncbi:sensor histidine kinase [Microvirga terrestris]|uniref:histidine kinase n=1 Tax=Microvirga terrestris TaxID=2791024 RepID=A0ABS0HT13_9HYPH|nr:HAMP domain-containing sensor histidine kinase [Microvirga terrestris]MBF9196620.1 HAMP domain-containing histidine kinase [Microvirga terrestris]
MPEVSCIPGGAARQLEPSTHTHDVPLPDLLSLLAHQFIAPLTQVDSSAQRMIHSAGQMTPDEIIVRATRMRQAVAQLSALVQSLIRRVQLDGRTKLQQRECDWTELVSIACEQVRTHQPERRFKIKKGKSASVRCDPLLLEQVFELLIGNAAKYSPLESAIEIEGFVVGGNFAIAIKDHGVGIPEEDLPLLFRPFFRSRRTTSVNGVGLGLALANQIVNAHSGKIHVVSQEGRGSTFTVMLPMEGSLAGQDGEP